MQYTCPMHPEILRDKPGPCPICGMDLEPLTPPQDNSKELREYHIWAKRFWLALILTVPVMILAMSGLHYPKIQFLLTTIVLFWPGSNIYSRAWASITNRSLNMFSLIGLGTLAAYLFSVIALIFPNIFPEALKMEGHVPLYFESAAVIITLVLLGQMLEARARGKTGMALSALIKESPKKARRIDSDGEHEVDIYQIKVGDHLRVLSGEKIPVDGIILEGQSHVDEAIITGEALPIKKEKKGHVIAGTMNQEGSFIMLAEKVGSETLLAQIVEMVAKAQRTLPPIQRVADKVSQYFVPAVIVIALITFLIWSIWGTEPRLIHAFVYAVSVLIIACPCALGLATPISIIVGVGRGAQMGILIKNAEALERMEKVNTLVIDKTGTLTEGFPVITDIVAKESFTEDRILQLAGSIEQGSEHPLAKAILTEVKKRNIPVSPIKQFESIPGNGVKGSFEDKIIMVGNHSLVDQFHISLSQRLSDFAQILESEAKTVLYVIESHEVIGILAVADQVKPTTKQAIDDLHQLGLRIVMLTGDNESIAKFVANKLGIDEYHAKVSPIEKGILIEKLKNEGAIVAMAGDGVNDAVALAKADVGIAMGTGAGVALESASVTLVNGDLTIIKRVILLSRLTMRNIWQNLFFAFFYNCLGIPLAAGILYPFWGITLTPMLAGLAMSFSSLSVLFNALRLKRIPIN